MFTGQLERKPLPPLPLFESWHNSKSFYGGGGGGAGYQESGERNPQRSMANLELDKAMKKKAKQIPKAVNLKNKGKR